MILRLRPMPTACTAKRKWSPARRPTGWHIMVLPRRWRRSSGRRRVHSGGRPAHSDAMAASARDLARRELYRRRGTHLCKGPRLGLGGAWASRASATALVGACTLSPHATRAHQRASGSTEPHLEPSGASSSARDHAQPRSGWLSIWISSRTATSTSGKRHLRERMT